LDIVQLWPWALFLLFVGGMLAIDLGVLHRDAHEVSRKEALIWTGFVMSAAIIFNAGVFLFKGTDAGIEWTTGYLIEQALSALPIPVTFLRPGWFIENALWDVASARENGVIHSFLMPLDKPIAMVATKDIGALAAKLIQEDWIGNRIVELEGPRRVSPNDLAAAFAKALGRPVRAEIVTRDGWEAMFRGQGATNPYPRIRMLDGFNEGWIDFVEGSAALRKGSIDADTVIAELVAREGSAK